MRDPLTDEQIQHYLNEVETLLTDGNLPGPASEIVVRTAIMTVLQRHEPRQPFSLHLRLGSLRDFNALATAYRAKHPANPAPPPVAAIVIDQRDDASLPTSSWQRLEFHDDAIWFDGKPFFPREEHE